MEIEIKENQVEEVCRFFEDAINNKDQNGALVLIAKKNGEGRLDEIWYTHKMKLQEVMTALSNVNLKVIRMLKEGFEGNGS